MNPNNTNNGSEAQSVRYSARLDALKEDVDRKLKELADKYVGTADPHLATIYNARMASLEWVLTRMQDQAWLALLALPKKRARKSPMSKSNVRASEDSLHCPGYPTLTWTAEKPDAVGWWFVIAVAGRQRCVFVANGYLWASVSPRGFPDECLGRVDASYWLWWSGPVELKKTPNEATTDND